MSPNRACAMKSSCGRGCQNSLLRDRVKFVGFRNDVPGILSQLDILVQSNRGPEGLGRSVLEAMACGVPVIAVNKWGPAELIQNGQTGLLFAPLDTKQLASHMLRLGRGRVLAEDHGATRARLDSTELGFTRTGREV